MKFGFNLAAFSIVAAITCSCTSSNHSGVSSHNGVITMNASAVKADTTLTSPEKAERLALMGEQLFTLTNFMYADELFDQSLALDANNLRAKFYKSLDATLMSLRGIMVRIKPMIITPEDLAKYKKVMAHMPNTAVKTFLLDGKEDIKTEKDAQAFVDTLISAQNQIREFVKANKNMELTLHLNDWAIPSAYQAAIDNCKVSSDDQTTYNLENCDLTHALEVKINRADAESIQQIAAGVELYMIALNSYDLTGTIATARKFGNSVVPNKVVYQELSKYADFATLRSSQNLKRVVALGVDAVAAVRWAKSIQTQLCKTGQENNNANRTGYLFSGGICIKDKTDDGQSVDDILKTADLVLSGQPYEVMVNENYRTKITPTAFLNNPIADLKKLHPAYNGCDLIQAVSDDTLGGIFPSKDANDVLASSSKCGN